MLNEFQLSLSGLVEAKGGLVARMFDQMMNRIAMDLRSAPDIPDRRKLTITIHCKPIIEDGELADVVTEIEIGHKIPHRITSIRCVVKKAANGAQQLFFNMDSPDNPQQHTLLPIEEREVKS